MLDKNLHELMMRLGENNNSDSSNDSDFKPVEFKIWERDSKGNLVSRPVRTVQYLDSNSNSNSNSNVNDNEQSQEPIITELGSRNSSKAGSSSSYIVSNPSNNDNINNKAKVIIDFMASKGRLL